MTDDRRHEDIVFRYVLERRARETPGREFLRFPDEELSWTYATADAEANRAATALLEFGIAAGDVVAVLADNSSVTLALIFGTTKLGAVVAPLNTALRGDYLTHAFTVSGAKLLIADEQYLTRLDGVVPGSVCSLVVAGNPEPVPAAVRDGRSVIGVAELLAGAGPAAPPDPGLRFWQPWAIIFTSGTTGPSKGVLTPYAQTHAMVAEPMLSRLTEADVFLGDMPLFHVSGWLSLASALYLGATDVIYPRVGVSSFWSRVRDNKITHVTLLTAVIKFLQQGGTQPERTTLRTALIGKAPPGFEAWRQQAGLETWYSFFNMTEVSSPLISPDNPQNTASSGRPRPGADVRLVDDNDIEVSPGQAGELVVRTELPWELNAGYVGMPDATAAAWRNGWFHTGDLFRQDADGEYYYVDRVKDSIRRRGENISSYELEAAVLSHPAVADAAAVGVPSEYGDDEIKLCLIATPEQPVDPVEIVSYLRPRVPHFAVPRFIEVYEGFPTTSTGKVRKAALREDGLARAWDREAAGIRVDRNH